MSSSEEARIHASLADKKTGVLKNRAGITDQKTLEEFEALSVESAAKTGLSKATNPLTIPALKQAHKEMFGRVYDWAGKFREYTTGRGQPFARPEYIEPQLNKIYSKMNSEIKPNMKKADFVKTSAEFIGELNSIHPFIEGNGRTQRLMLQRMATKANFSVAPKKINGKAWYKAAEESHLTATYGKFEKIISNSVAPKKLNEKDLKAGHVLRAMVSLSKDSSDANKKTQSESLAKAGVTSADYSKHSKMFLKKDVKKAKSKDKSSCSELQS